MNSSGGVGGAATAGGPTKPMMARGGATRMDGLRTGTRWGEGGRVLYGTMGREGRTDRTAQKRSRGYQSVVVAHSTADPAVPPALTSRGYYPDLCSTN